MIHLAVRLAGADLRRSPGRAAAVAALLLVAVLLPEVVRVSTLVGLVLAVVVAASATAGSAAQEERRARILAESGAGAGAQALVGGAALVVPGGAAVTIAVAIGLVADSPVAPVPAVLAGLVVPVVVGAAVARTAVPGPGLGRRGTVAVGVLIALTAPLLIVPLVLLALLVGRRLGRARLGVRVAVTVVAVAVTVGAAVAMSGAETFFDLGFLLLLLAVPLTVAVGWLGTVGVAAVAALVARLGPTARLATAPLGRRRRQLGPIAAVVTVVVTLAAAEGVVGASFEEREAARAPAAVLGVAGTRDDQTIAVTTGLDPADQRALVAESVGPLPVLVATIDRVGAGGTDVEREPAPEGVVVLDLNAAARLPPEVTVPVADGPSWVGVVAPEALGPLGLDAHAEALARGDALALNPRLLADGDRVEVAGGEAGPLTVPVVRVSERTGLLLPAVLVSEARAAELGGVRSGARVIAVPGPGAAPGDAATVAERVHDALDDDGAIARAAEGLDGTARFTSAVERRHTPSGGDEELRRAGIAPLDQVPMFSRTADDGQRRAVTFAALAVLVALAGTLLVLGGGRSDDAVLLVQGASDRHRLTTGVVQTTTVALAGTALGALVGLGVPALAFGLYNGRERDARTLDIPYVVPPGLVVLLVALPVVTALLAGAVVAMRARPSARALADAART